MLLIWIAGVAHPAVSIWILDKRSMMEVGASPAEIEAAAETARRDAAGLTRLKHPAVVKVAHLPHVSATWKQLSWLTEKRSDFAIIACNLHCRWLWALE